MLYPLIYVISSSFSSGHAVTIGKVWLLPVEPTLHGYRTAFAYPQILRGFQNSAIYTAFGTLINVVMTILIAYPLSRRDFYGRKVIMMGLVFTMMFYGGLIPTYLTVRAVGILNTRLAMVVPQALAVWQVIIARTFFQSTIADELADAADIDGCSDLGLCVVGGAAAVEADHRRCWSCYTRWGTGTPTSTHSCTCTRPSCFRCRSSCATC